MSILLEANLHWRTSTDLMSSDLRPGNATQKLTVCSNIIGYEQFCIEGVMALFVTGTSVRHVWNHTSACQVESWEADSTSASGMGLCFAPGGAWAELY